MRPRLLGQRRIGRDQRRDLGRLLAVELAIEPGEKFSSSVMIIPISPSSASSALRPRTSRLETVPIGRPSNSAASR